MMADLKECADSLLSVTTITTMDVTDAKTLYVVPDGKTCILTRALLHTAADVGAGLTVTIGRSTALTDFLDTQTLTNLDAAGDVVCMMPVPNATPVKQKEYPAAAIIQMNVTGAGNDVDATVYLFGILDDA